MSVGLSPAVLYVCVHVFSSYYAGIAPNQDHNHLKALDIARLRPYRIINWEEKLSLMEV